MLKTIKTASASYSALWLAISLFSTVSQAHVHHDADGNSVSWYPKICCGNGDCQPATEVRHVGAGVWLHTADGLTLFVDSRQPRRQSQDLRWHICTQYDYDAQTIVANCVFEPGGAA
jgi:hypothetical protein